MADTRIMILPDLFANIYISQFRSIFFKYEALLLISCLLATKGWNIDDAALNINQSNNQSFNVSTWITIMLFDKLKTLRIICKIVQRNDFKASFFMIIEHQSYTLFNCISAHPHQKQQGIEIMQDIYIF